MAAHATSGDVVLDLYATPQAGAALARRAGAAADAAGLRPVLVTRRRAGRDDRHRHPAGAARGLPAARPAAGRRARPAARRARRRRWSPCSSHVRDPGNAGTVLRAADAAGRRGGGAHRGQRRRAQPQVRAGDRRQPVPPAGRAGRRAGRRRGRAARARAWWCSPRTARATSTWTTCRTTPRRDEAALLRRPDRVGLRQRGLGADRRSSARLADAVVRVPLRGARREPQPRDGGHGLPVRLVARAAAPSWHRGARVDRVPGMPRGTAHASTGGG